MKPFILSFHHHQPFLKLTHILAITILVTQNKNCPIFFSSCFVFFSWYLFITSAFGLLVKWCSLWKVLSMDLRIPKSVLVCLHFNCVVDHIVVRMLFVTSGIVAGTFQNQEYTSVQGRAKWSNWMIHLQHSKIGKPFSFPFILPVPSLYLASRRKTVLFFCTVFWN